MGLIDEMRTAVPGKAVYDRGAGSVSGLYAKIRPGSLKKGYFLAYRTRSKIARCPKIGDYDQIGLSDARKRARMLLDRVFNGEDPKMDWEASALELSVDELFEKILESHWSKARFVKSGWGKQVRLNYARLKPTFGRLRLSEVGPLKVRQFRDSLSETPIAANRCLEVLSKMYNYALEYELTRHPNPCTPVQSFTEKKRKRYAGEEEIRAVARILDREFEQKPKQVIFVYFLIFTGARPRDLENARRDQLKVLYTDEGKSYGILTFNGKTTAETGEQEEVIVPHQAMVLLNRMKVPGDGTLFGCRNPIQFWRAVRIEAGCADLWSRDWRRTFASIGFSAGVNAGILGEVQNHRSAQTRQRYQKLSTEARLGASNAVAERIAEIMCGTETVNGATDQNSL